MAKRNESSKKRERAREDVTVGSANVLADLDFPDVEERQTKLRLAYAINQIVAQGRLTQSAAAQLLDITQPKVSALSRYRLDGFSVERLMTFLTALDRDVEIHIRHKAHRKTPARITVVAA